MNRIIFSLVSYFAGLIFFVGVAQAATYNVTVTTADNSVNTLYWAINQANSNPGPHTINIVAASTGFWGSTLTLTASNVTINGGFTGCDPNRVVDLQGASLVIQGGSCVVTGIIFRSSSLVLQSSNNRVWGCWFNMNSTGDGAQGSLMNNTAAVYVNGGTNNTIGLGSQCRNIFSGSQMSDMIRVDGTSTGTIISNNYMGVGKDGVTTIAAAGQDGVNFVSGSMSGSRIDSNIIVSTVADVIKLGGDFSSSFIRKNTIKSSSAGNGILASASSTVSNTVISGNTINSNYEAGIFIQGTANSLQITSNNIGATSAGIAGTGLGNSNTGIKIQANTNSLTMSNNVVLDNGYRADLHDQATSSGIYVYASGVTMSNVSLTNNKVGVDASGTPKGNAWAGIYFENNGGSITTATVSGNTVGDNGSNPTYPQKSHGIAFLNISSASATNIQVTNNFIGVTPTTYANVGNYGNGIEMNNVSGFTLSGNEVGYNKFATTRSGWTGGGIMINGGSSNGMVRGNYIGVSSTNVAIGNTNPGNATYPNQMAGITVQGSSNITIGGTSAGQGNIIKNNNWGIQLVNTGATNATSTTIQGNTISNQTAYGIYAIGASGNTIGGSAANAGNIISNNGADGVYVLNTTSLNNLVSRNQIFCNAGQGIKLNYGASAGNSGQQPPVITSVSGNTVAGTATSGATVEIFIDDPTCQIACGSSTSDNRREGKTYLATVTATGGNWTYTSGSAIDANNVSATATVGTNTSEFSYCNIVTICPPAADAGPNQNLCNVTSTTLAANNVTASGGTGTWTVVSGTGTVTSVNNPNSTVTGLTVGGTTILKWTVTASGCTTTQANVTITVSAPVTPTASATSNVCSTSPVVTLTGSNPSPGTGVWTVVSGGTASFGNANNASTTATISSGTSVTFRWTVTNGACSGFSDATTTVSSPVSASASATSSVCSSSPTVTLTGNNPSPGTGTWTVSGGTATFGNANNASTTATITSGTSLTFTWTITNGACITSANAATTVTSPVTATASATSSVCSTSPNVTLTGSNPSPGTGTWTVFSGGAATFGNANNASTTASITSGTSVTFRWTIVNGPCSTHSDATTTVTSPVSASASATSSVCSTSPTVTLTGNNPSPGTGLWTVSGGAATFGNASNASTTATITSGTSLTFTWTITNGPCTSSANASTTVTSPTTATATATSNVCSSSPLVTLGATPSTGTWSVASGGTATFGNANNASTTATITSGTSVTFRWTTTNGPCTSTADAVTTVSSPISASASSNTNAVCNTSPTVTLTGANPSPGTGTWTVSGGTATFGNANSATTSATITSGTSLTFTWTIVNGACTTNASTNVITVSSPVDPVTASATSAVCSSSPVITLSGSNPSPGTGAWTVSGGTVTFGNAGSESTTATVTSGTSLTFTWTVTNGPCVTSATASSTVNAAVTANAGPDQALCNDATTTLAANTPSPGTGNWTTVSGSGVVTTASDPNSGVTGLTIGGTSVFRWTVTNGACSATSDVSVSVSAPGTISAGADRSICNTTTVTLTGTGSGTWTLLTGTGTIVSPTNSTTQVNGLTVGMASSFRWEVSSGACSGADTVVITVDALPVGNAGGNQALCNATTIDHLSATGSGTWSTVSGSGVATTPSDPTSGVTGLTVGGSTTLRWTLVNGSCSVPDDIIITSSSPVAANGGSDVQVCNGTTATLSATGTGNWTANATMGTGTVTTPSDPSSGVTGLTVGQTSTFEWIVTNGACADTALVQVTSYAQPTANAGADRAICNTTTANLAASGAGTWSVFTGTGVVTTPTDPNSGVTNLTIGATTVFIWSVQNGTCSATDSIALTVSPGTNADAGNNQTLCNETTTTLDATAGTNGHWSASTDATITDLNDPKSSVTVINSPATLTWQIDGGGCGTASATVTIYAVTLDKPVISGTGLSEACSGSTYAYSVSNVDMNGTYNWTTSTSDITVSPSTGTNVNVSASSSGKLMVFVDKLGCSDSASADVTVLPPPPSGRDTLKLATCIYTNYIIKTDLFDGFNGTWSSTSGSLTFTFNSTDSTTTISGLVDGTSDTLTYHISNNCGSVDFIYVIKVGGYFTDIEAAGPSDTLCVSDARTITAQVTPSGNYTYYWVSNLNYNNPVIDATVHIDSTTVPVYSVHPQGASNVYFVYVMDKTSMCKSAIDTAYVYAVEGQDLNVPNLITPNEDGLNDHWILRDKVTGKDILPGSKFDLYNRWGQRVFTMDNYDNRFDAAHISDGVYYFYVKSGCGDKEYKGWLQILGNTNP